MKIQHEIHCNDCGLDFRVRLSPVEPAPAYCGMCASDDISTVSNEVLEDNPAPAKAGYKIN